MIRRKKGLSLSELKVNSKIEHGKCIDWKMFSKLKSSQHEEDVFDNYILVLQVLLLVLHGTFFSQITQRRPLT